MFMTESGDHKMQQNKVLLPIFLQVLKYSEEGRKEGKERGYKERGTKVEGMDRKGR